MTETKVAPPVKDLFYVGIDGTEVIDTIAWGALWRDVFGWKNLLLQLNADSADANRRLDPTHPDLPMITTEQTRTGKKFKDVCIMPEGLDGKGLDAKWPGPNPQDNVSKMNDQLSFTQLFTLNPRVDSATHTLSADGGDIVADVVFISSHGATNGDMFGVESYTLSGVDYIFSLIQATALNRRFAGPKWVLLSNCNTLFPATHNDWLDLIVDPASPLRGIVGFRDACPLAGPSVDLFATLIDQMRAGKTIIQGWQKSLTAHSLEKNWIVLAHEEAVGDTIQAWNAGTLPPITKLAPPSVKQFTSDDPTGKTVTHTTAPFEVFWSKGGTRITASNRLDTANKIATGDKVLITVNPPPPAATFTAGAQVALMLVYIRVTYNQIVDVTKMFTIDTAASSGIKQPVKMKPVNSFRVKSNAPDTWIFEVDGTPASAILSLTCGNLDLSSLGHHNVPLWLRGWIKFPAITSILTFDFIRDGSIIAK
jgi:hypothetical protein